MSKITGTGAGIKFLISAFNMVKRGEIKKFRCSCISVC